MGGGGGSSNTKIPSQLKPYLKYGKPMAQQMADAATEGQPLWQVPGMPTTPGVGTVPGPVLPTQQYFQSIAPEIQSALWNPYQQVLQQTMETIGSKGQLGSARGGLSGAAGAAAGQFAAQAAPQLAMQAWQMGAPEMQRYGQQAFEVGQMMPYQAALQQRAEQLQALQAPWSMYPSYMGGAGQMPLTQPAPGVSGMERFGTFGTGLGGAGIGYVLGGPAGAAIGGGLGLMGGQTLFGGK